MQPPRLLNNLHGRSVSTTASEDKLLFYCNSSILCVNLLGKKNKKKQAHNNPIHQTSYLMPSSTEFFITLQHCAEGNKFKKISYFSNLELSAIVLLHILLQL